MQKFTPAILASARAPMSRFRKTPLSLLHVFGAVLTTMTQKSFAQSIAPRKKTAPKYRFEKTT
ncbi:hypothetical protein [Noviherbaspirillum galbum]|uniref:Uncharacterized protein n=1 Tax=Noviherbaspirillum galbum TaxID=2709383 RepID=A0A6B3SSP4_9BURK|nr:hypothetical protein [Noviherbaspirillum galbum]NEX63787.1 hypothetical protein [Noviherbaspirillum galbum]